MTPPESLTLRVVDALSACAVPYLLAGSFASNFSWCHRHGTLALMKEIRRSVPEI